MMNKSFLTASLLGSVLIGLTACSTFKPVTYDCSQLVTAPPIGTRISLASETGQFAAIRLNGVSAICEDKGEQVKIELAIGMKVSRDLATGQGPALLEVPFIAAKVDGSQTVTGYESFSYRMAFGKDIDLIYPLTRQDMTITKGGRVVLSLITEPIDLK